MYWVHTRRKILGTKKREGLTFIEAGKRYGMSPNTIFKWTKRIELDIFKFVMTSLVVYVGLPHFTPRSV